MPPTFFTTNDGDIILRAGVEPGPKHDFRVHKLILSLTSPVFKDMLAFPQPPDQNQTKLHQLPITDVPDPPEVLDMILRLIYPGVEPTKITDLPTMFTLLSAVDKYDMITSTSPILREALKVFIPGDSFGVYAIACRFGFSEVAEAAAQVVTPLSMLDRKCEEEVRHMESIHLLRLVRSVLLKRPDPPFALDLGPFTVENYRMAMDDDTLQPLTRLMMSIQRSIIDFFLVVHDCYNSLQWTAVRGYQRTRNTRLHREGTVGW